MKTWLQLLGTGTAAAVITQLGPVLARRLNWRQAKAETARTEAESVKIAAEAASVSVSSLIATITELQSRLSTARADLDAAAGEIASLRQVVHDLHLAVSVHEPWDAEMIAAATSRGESPCAPPPLWPVTARTGSG